MSLFDNRLWDSFFDSWDGFWHERAINSVVPERLRDKFTEEAEALRPVLDNTSIQAVGIRLIHSREDAEDYMLSKTKEIASREGKSHSETMQELLDTGAYEYLTVHSI